MGYEVRDWHEALDEMPDVEWKLSGCHGRRRRPSEPERQAAEVSSLRTISTHPCTTPRPHKLLANMVASPGTQSYVSVYICSMDLTPCPRLYGRRAPYGHSSGPHRTPRPRPRALHHHPLPTLHPMAQSSCNEGSIRIQVSRSLHLLLSLWNLAPPAKLIAHLRPHPTACPPPLPRPRSHAPQAQEPHTSGPRDDSPRR